MKISGSGLEACKERLAGPTVGTHRGLACGVRPPQLASAKALEVAPCDSRQSSSAVMAPPMTRAPAVASMQSEKVDGEPVAADSAESSVPWYLRTGVAIRGHGRSSGEREERSARGKARGARREER
eukprot:scaffold120873_cov29-Tisochrysis_lutea.AAC.4